MCKNIVNLRPGKRICFSMGPMHLKQASARATEHLTAKIMFFLRHNYGKDIADNHSIDTDDRSMNRSGREQRWRCIDPVQCECDRYEPATTAADARTTHSNKEGPLCCKGPTVCDTISLPCALCNEPVMTSNLISLPIIQVEIEPRVSSSFAQHAAPSGADPTRNQA